MGVFDEKPWLKSYKLGPFKLKTTGEPYPEVPLFSFLDEAAANYPSKSACLFKGRKMTWREVKDCVDRLAYSLHDLGIEKGDRVATILPTSPQSIITDFAIQKTGGVHVPCSILHRESELIYELGASGTETVICSDELVELVEVVKAETNVKRIITTSLDDFSKDPPSSKAPLGTHRLLELLDQGDPLPPEVVIDPKTDLALLAFTGGSTGTPKGVMLTHFNLVANTLQSLPWALGPLEQGIIGKSSILITLPTFHIYGNWCVRAATRWGLQMLLNPDPRDYDVIIDLLKNYRPFMAGFVPTQYMKLIEKKIGRTNTAFTSGAAPLPKVIAEIFRKDTGMPITEAYGLTETGPLTHFNLSSFAKITGFMPFEKEESIGVPIIDTQVKLINPASGQEVPLGEVGELYIKGPQVMKGYWPEPGAGLIDGWLPTGDLCKADEDGYFFLVDRNKDMINVSGYKVYSTTVDSAIFEHPGVAQAAAIGIPDPERPGSERIKAFVVLNEEHKDNVTEADIIAFLKTKLSPYAIPKSIEFRDKLPMTATEKLYKKRLREEEIKRMENEYQRSLP